MAALKAELTEHLLRLYEQAPSDNAYLRSHASRSSAMRQVESFLRYADHLPRRGSILDWGCFHAPDACMIRARFGNSVELHGCDFHDPCDCEPFHRSADLQYTRLEDARRLPYDDDRFDAVIGAGVLEHVSMDFEALKELHRVLRPGGVLVLTFIPNRWSYVEWCARRLSLEHHRRLYSKSEIRWLLLHHGFEPIRLRYHQLVPAQRFQRLFGPVYRADGFLEALWPLRLLAANIMAVSRRLSRM